MSYTELVDPNAPETLVAQDFMTRKGYEGLFPFAMDTVEGRHPFWYFYYRMPEGDLELEVSWNQKMGTWDTLVTGFQLHE